jgi:hypothetical protein
MRFRLENELVDYSAEVLVPKDSGMTWTQIAKFFRKKSVEYQVTVPHPNTMFPSHLPNRRTGFVENLRAFSRRQQIILLTELCEANKKNDVTFLKTLLKRNYHELDRLGRL